MQRTNRATPQLMLKAQKLVRPLGWTIARMEKLVATIDLIYTSQAIEGQETGMGAVLRI